MIATGPETVRRRLLKVAAAELVHQVGGIEAAAATLERGKSGVGRWVNRSEPDHSIPVHELARLEQIADRPVLTEALCRLAGGIFVPHINAGADEGSAEWIAMTLAKELGDVSGAIATALADDRRIDAAEARGVLIQLEDLERGAAQLRAHMERLCAEDTNRG
jgi:hypothetical protein